VNLCLTRKMPAQHDRLDLAALVNALRSMMTLAGRDGRGRPRGSSLLELSDRLLQDIGLDRPQVRAAEYSGFPIAQLRAAAGQPGEEGSSAALEDGR
jgi:uncharacterized protein YjiS (DUF1127 family)